MTYSRFIERNDLEGDYDETPKGKVRGDLRRLEDDQRVEGRLKVYAEGAGITTAQARNVLDRFLED